MRFLPVALVVIRFFLGPAVFWMAHAGMPRPWIFAAVAVASLSDLLDGIIARRLKVVTERLRVADSWTDTWYYVWVAATVWQLRPDVVYDYRFPLLSVLALQLLCWAIDLLKYRRFATYHAYTAKAWGFALFFATAALLAFDVVGPFMWLAILMGWVSLIEGIAITLVLPTWTHDVLSVWHAWRLREAHASARPVAEPVEA